MTMLARRKM